MFLEKKLKKHNIERHIICIDDKHTVNITEYNTYHIIDIYISDNNKIFLIEDDDGFLSGYESTRFIGKSAHRNSILDSILS